MTWQPQITGDCRRFDDVADRQAAERPLSREDETFSASHLRSCPRCSGVETLFEELRLQGDPGACEPLDEITRRRLLRELATRARQGPAATGPQEVVETRPVTRRRSSAALFVAACFLAALGLAIWLASQAPAPGKPTPTPSGHPSVVPVPGPRNRANPARPAGRYVMAPDRSEPSSLSVAMHRRAPGPIKQQRPSRRRPLRLRPSTPMAATPQETRPTAAALLRAARKRRMVRDWQGAAALYRKVMRLHVGAAEAGAARVSLGLLLLVHMSQPLKALRHFEEYLKGGTQSTLAQEASLGQIRALRKLGRLRAEATAIRRFVRRFGAALQTPQLRRRLKELTRPASRSRTRAR